ncbi:hypothetical protein F2Q69_00006580 [Brassica cretica]|uniref:Uncharacterized protein n=1 Tax=Brassica cretica TaxID=69181 RepID=A0A8S9P5R0_BRACR|nr:hypothetical protein F2Q69_00006580 [Brassica cretica]
MSSSEDKCEVSKDKYRDRRKNGIFLQSHKLDRGQKGKEQTASRGVYKDVEVEDAGGQFFLLLELSALRN